MNARAIDMTGKTFGSLVAIACAGIGSDGKYQWRFACECGKEFTACGSKVRRGEVITCPECSMERVRLSHIKHGRARTPEHRAWSHIKSRCFNQKVPEYKHYGGRGITMCQRWIDSFENFLADMGSKPSKLHSIDRIDNNGNYEPSNCRWASFNEQANNKRSNRLVIINSKSKTMSEWATENGLNREIVHKRLRRGWSGESLIASPMQAQKISYCGKNASIPEWSEITGIKTATLYWRIKQKWPLDKALTKGARQ